MFTGFLISLLFSRFPFSLLCRCLTKTKAMGYTIFGLTNRGQCHAGNQETKLNKLAKDGRFAPPPACSNTNKGLCNVLNETENCFGKDMHSFYYQVMKTGNFYPCTFFSFELC